MASRVLLSPRPAELLEESLVLMDEASLTAEFSELDGPASALNSVSPLVDLTGGSLLGSIIVVQSPRPWPPFYGEKSSRPSLDHTRGVEHSST